MVDGMLKDEDKADTVEGEEEVIAQRRAFSLSNCFRVIRLTLSSWVASILADESPKNPVVFCHGVRPLFSNSF